MVVASEKTKGQNSVVCKAINLKFGLLLGLYKGYKLSKFHGAACNSSPFMALQKFEKLAVLPPLLENEIRYRVEICFILFTIKGPGSVQKINKSNRKAMNRNWSNQKANPAPKTKAGNK